MGDPGVGKSSLVHRYVFEQCNPDQMIPTIGVAFSTKLLTVGDRTIKLQLWDTAGQERFRSIARIYYKDSVGCLAVFDVTSKKSVENLHYWIKNYEDSINCKYTIILVGNKADVPESKWEVSKNDILDLKKQYNCECFLTSARIGTNINEMFTKLAEQIIYDPNEYSIMEEEKSTSKKFRLDISDISDVLPNPCKC